MGLIEHGGELEEELTANLNDSEPNEGVKNIKMHFDEYLGQQENRSSSQK